MSARQRTVALQAVGVAVIAAIIFVAFLRPDEPGSLSGIDVPGGVDEPIVNSPPPDPDREQRGSKRSDGNRGPGNRADRPQGSARGAGQEGGSGESTPGGDDSIGDDTPPDDQYDDLITRLMKHVGEPTLIEERAPGP